MKYKIKEKRSCLLFPQFGQKTESFLKKLNDPYNDFSNMTFLRERAIW